MLKPRGNVPLLKKKHQTTPLLLPEDRPPLEELPIKKPPVWRVFWIAGKLSVLLSYVFLARFSSRLTLQFRAVEVREFLERMGGMWMKLGQVMAMRSDLFAIEFCRELSKLHDQAITFSPRRSAEIIIEELGCPIEEVFDQFEPEPFAAASLSQAHKARRRKDGQWVVIKVQRPYAEDYYCYDFKWLRVAFKFLNFFKAMKHYHFKDMLQEIELMMEEELDYRHEASNMIKLRETLKAHDIDVPKVYLKHSTQRILIMEFLDGVFMSDYISVLRRDPERAMAWLAENHIQTKKVARQLIQTALRQLYEDRIFHGDMHPGNILLLKNNHLALIDFGNVGKIDPQFAAQYDQYFRALAEGSFDKATDLLLLTMGKLPVVDIAALKKRVIKVLERQAVRSGIKNLPYAEKSIGSTSAELSRVMAEYHINVNWQFLKMARTFEIVDQNIGILNPKFDFVKEMKKYEAGASKRKNCARIRQASTLMEKISDLSDIIVPTLTRRAFQFDGRVTVGFKVAALIFRLLSYALLFLLFGSVWAYFYQHHNEVVANFHTTENWFTKWVEAIPQLRKFEWCVIVIALIGGAIGIRRFIRDLLKPPVRLPGD